MNKIKIWKRTFIEGTNLYTEDLELETDEEFENRKNRENEKKLNIEKNKIKDKIPFELLFISIITMILFIKGISIIDTSILINSVSFISIISFIVFIFMFYYNPTYMIFGSGLVIGIFVIPFFNILFIYLILLTITLTTFYKFRMSNLNLSSI